jgi:hypothetical protein
MANTDATLTHADINGGVAVELNAESIVVEWRNITSGEPAEGSFDVVEVDCAGFENQKIIIRGTIDADSSTPNQVTVPFLLDFGQVNTGSSNMMLTISAGQTPTYFKGRPATGYEVGGAYRDFIYVQIDTITFTANARTSQEGQAISYTITMRETKEI